MNQQRQILLQKESFCKGFLLARENDVAYHRVALERNIALTETARLRAESAFKALVEYDLNDETNDMYFEDIPEDELDQVAA